MTERVQTSSSFDAVEQRIEVTRQRMRGFPHEEATLTRLIAHLQKRIQDRYHAVLKPHGLNYSSYTALMMMYGTPDYTVSPSELASTTGEKPNNVTHICDDLVKRGIVERQHCRDDRRRIDLTLTAKGRKLIEQLQPEIWQALAGVYTPFSDSEKKRLGALLRKQLRNLEGDG